MCRANVRRRAARHTESSYTDAAYTDNHCRVAPKTPRANPGGFMQSVLTGYAVGCNPRHRKRGHLMQGRRKTRPIEGMIIAFLMRNFVLIRLNEKNEKKTFNFSKNMFCANPWD